MSTVVDVIPQHTRVRIHHGEEGRRTLCVGPYKSSFGIVSGYPVKVQPFAESEREFGNRAMTTTVIIHPHPAPGLKVKVDLVSPVDGGVNTTDYLKAGDPVRTVYASDSMAVHVSEVPDEPMQEVEGNELPPVD